MSRQLPLAKRQCGDCTLCCTALGVEELAKPRDVPCGHIIGKGCGIYQSRPQSCQDFECLWLQGIIPHHLKPSKTKVVFSTNTHEGYRGKPGEVLVLFVRPQDHGIWQKGPVAKFLKTLRRTGVQVVITCGKKTYLDGALYGRKDFKVKQIGDVAPSKDTLLALFYLALANLGRP